jgi:membrane-bound lytic murein transglycosylase D
MKRLIIIFLGGFILPVFTTGNLYAQITPAKTTEQVAKDSSLDPDPVEDKMIDEVVKARVLPSKEKVQYFSQVTKYGFKNLFKNYSYNSSMPYSSQMNSHASSFIQDYMQQHGKYLQDMKTWGQPYFNLIENILTQYGLPKELKYIAVIESNLKTSAVSIKGAGGPWQFMPATARQFNLVINNYVDERTDYYKSTHAAAKYLLSLYRDLKDWLLVMAAYNGGAGRVYSAIRQSGSKDFWQLQGYLPRESSTYVKRFIATHYIMEGGANMPNIPSDAPGMMTAGGPSYYAPGIDPYQMNKPNLNEAEMRDIEVLGVSGKFNSLIIAKNLTMEISEFNRLNPNFDDMLANTGNYDLRLPPDKMQLFSANKYSILNECVQVLLSSDVEYKTTTVYPKPQMKKYATKKRARG